MPWGEVPWRAANGLQVSGGQNLGSRDGIKLGSTVGEGQQEDHVPGTEKSRITEEV